jgi:DHA1 family bicyclomycin/chloramphenicol resistance-like MFS transporter
MVRDFFPPREGAKIFSLLMLIIAVSPMLAPTVGGIVTTALGWHWVFVLLASFAFLLMLVNFFVLPEGHEADPGITLKPGPIFRTYLSILREPQFYTYALSGAFAFSGLFVYVAGSPILFMDIFRLNAQTYGGIFAFLSVGLIGAAQLNILLTRRFSSEKIFRTAVAFQALVGLLFLAGTLLGGFGLVGTVALLFATLSSVGLSNPNASALALAPFAKNAGSASALLGFLQIGTGAVASAGIGMIDTKSALPIVAILSLSSLIALAIFFTGRRRIHGLVEGEEGDAVMAH